MRTVAFCEIDPHCRRVLAKHWPDVPCHDDVRTLDGRALAVDVICGGFPCQDISSSGPRVGLAGGKSGLWREYLRLIREVRPRYVIVENVSDLLHRGLGTVLGDLASSGYDAEWRCVPASIVGLPQTRDRMWIVAYPGRSGLAPGDERKPPIPKYFRWADDDRLGEAQYRAQSCATRAWRDDDGVPGWMDRMRSLGNAVVPEIPEAIGRAIMKVAFASAYRKEKADE
jgi:DNA (cytosine-5)-methyltransferase 1